MMSGLKILPCCHAHIPVRYCVVRMVSPGAEPDSRLGSTTLKAVLDS